MTDDNQGQEDPQEGSQQPENGQESPQDQQPNVPMPNATGEELRAEIRRLRDENKERRLSQRELENKFSAMDGRLGKMQEAFEQQAQAVRQAEFRSLALEAGVEPGLIGFLNIDSFDLEDREKTLEALGNLPQPKKGKSQESLPASGEPAATGQQKPLTVDDLDGLSDEEFQERLGEIVALKREAPYR